MEDGSGFFTIEAVLAIAFAIAGWLVKDKFAELARKDLALTWEAFEQAKEIARLDERIKAQQREIEHLSKGQP